MSAHNRKVGDYVYSCYLSSLDDVISGMIKSTDGEYMRLDRSTLVLHISEVYDNEEEARVIAFNRQIDMINDTIKRELKLLKKYKHRLEEAKKDLLIINLAEIK